MNISWDGNLMSNENVDVKVRSKSCMFGKARDILSSLDIVTHTAIT